MLPTCAEKLRKAIKDASMSTARVGVLLLFQNTNGAQVGAIGKENTGDDRQEGLQVEMRFS